MPKTIPSQPSVEPSTENRLYLGDGKTYDIAESCHVHYGIPESDTHERPSQYIAVSDLLKLYQYMKKHTPTGLAMILDGRLKDGN